MNSQSDSDPLAQLRSQLRERFPEAHAQVRTASVDEDEGLLSTGVEALDAIGFGKGMLGEGVAERRSVGSGLLLSKILESVTAREEYAVLIDGRDTFDPQLLGSEACRRLLWVRCRQAAQAVKAADLLLRDGNLPLILMDLECNAPREVGKIPNTSWYRLRHLVEQTGTTLFVITPMRLISSAHLRVSFAHQFEVDDLDERTEQLVAQLELHVMRHQRDFMKVRTG